MYVCIYVCMYVFIYVWVGECALLGGCTWVYGRLMGVCMDGWVGGMWVACEA